MNDYTSKDIQRFWSKVNKNGSIPAHVPELGKCWEWKRCLISVGYGAFTITRNKKQILIYSHRMVWELTNSEIPKGLWVLHKCDNPKCCNPKHLFLGTARDNTLDMIQKGRNGHNKIKGELSPNHKLTTEQVLYIRDRYALGNITMKEIADEMNVHYSSISLVINRKRWK